MKNFNQLSTVTTYLFNVNGFTFFNEWNYSQGEVKVLCDGDIQSYIKINKKYFTQKQNNFEAMLVSKNIVFKKETIQKF
jgi:hypothetical protein